MSVYQTPLVVKQRFDGVEFLYLPCLASEKNVNLTYNEMAYLWHQGIDVDDENYPALENILDDVTHPENT